MVQYDHEDYIMWSFFYLGSNIFLIKYFYRGINILLIINSRLHLYTIMRKYIVALMASFCAKICHICGVWRNQCKRLRVHQFPDPLLVHYRPKNPLRILAQTHSFLVLFRYSRCQLPTTDGVQVDVQGIYKPIVIIYARKAYIAFQMPHYVYDI